MITHWDAIVNILKYLKKAPEKSLLYSDFGHTRVVVSHMQIRKVVILIDILP